MAIVSSGAVSFLNLQNEFGGANPISLSEYYNGGAYVPSSSYGAYVDNYNSSTYYWGYYSPSNPWLKWFNEHNQFVTVSSPYDTYISNGIEYSRGSFVTSTVNYVGRFYLFRIKRRTVGIAANSSIPTSGLISMNQFYGSSNT